MADSSFFLGHDHGGARLAGAGAMIRRLFLALLVFCSLPCFSAEPVPYVSISGPFGVEYLIVPPVTVYGSTAATLNTVFNDYYSGYCAVPASKGIWIYQSKAYRYKCNDGRDPYISSSDIKLCNGYIHPASGCVQHIDEFCDSPNGDGPLIFEPDRASCNGNSCVVVTKAVGTTGAAVLNTGLNCKAGQIDGIDCAMVASSIGGGFQGSYFFDYFAQQPACSISHKACPEGQNWSTGGCVTPPPPYDPPATCSNGATNPPTCSTGGSTGGGSTGGGSTGGGSTGGGSTGGGDTPPDTGGGVRGPNDPTPSGNYPRCASNITGGAGGLGACPETKTECESNSGNTWTAGGGQYISNGVDLGGSCSANAVTCLSGGGTMVNGRCEKAGQADSGGGTGTCTNGATNYPACDNGGGTGTCTNGATNYPACDNGGGTGTCTNGATNYPTCNNQSSGGGTPNGSLTDKWATARTIGGALGDFVTAIRGTTFVQAAGSVVSFSVSGSCPAWVFSEPYFLKVNIDMSPYLCGSLAAGILAAIGVVFVIGAVWSAWWIIFVL